ncbi:membrane protein [Bacteroidia bacterium]|nr:membrane protein [Bacteroidia bacterium]
MIVFLKKYWLSTLLCAVILVLCFADMSQVEADMPMTNFDKLVHFVMFLAVSGVVFFENTAHLKLKTSERRLFFGSLIFPIVFSGLIEIMQEYLTAYRTGDWMDFLFDSIGAVVGWGICRGFFSR